ncbi:MDR family MFS transporter [Staphylospora marina]|uniref:MDR family MFS transporter n=1 Tax=Staphylospora marina TaxID=2490858 RepID=UPI000F5BF2C3|nr:MDR family MFS transporter [Staphylospora marina]
MSQRSNKPGFVVAGLLLGILMAAMDNTIVATAMGTIIAELGGLDKFVWVTSAYMIAAMAATPVFGKLSDMYGRKRFFVFGSLVFLVGSALCGMADSIIELSIYRAVQGIGGGALMPIAFTIVFDIFPPEKRGKMTGLLGAVFGVSSIFGPLLGAYITEAISWRWVFYINLLPGVISVLLVVLFYRDSLEKSKQKIDWLGVATLVFAVTSLMIVLETGGTTYAWDSPVILGLLAAFVLLTVAFVYAEKRAAEPVISFAMFRQRLFATSNLAAFFIGATYIVATLYIPLFVQGVLGGTVTNSGMILLPMMLGSVVASQIGGMLANRFSYRTIMLVSGIVFVAGILLLSTLSGETSREVVTLYMIIVGLGTGAHFSVLGMAAIHHFDIRQRGTANSTLAFLRSLGMALGITVFGIIQRNLFESGLKNAFPSGGGAGHGAFGDPRALLSPEARIRIPEHVLNQITDVLSTSIAKTFMWALIPAVLSCVVIFLMSRERLDSLESSAPVKPAPSGE